MIIFLYNDPALCCYWAVIWCLFQNNIPVFSPALTDGAIGDMFYLFSTENPGLILDIIEGKQVLLLNLSLWCSLVTHNAFHFRYFKVEQPGSGCQQLRDNRPGRRCSQTPHMQCQFLGKYFVFLSLMCSVIPILNLFGQICTQHTNTLITFAPCSVCFETLPSLPPEGRSWLCGVCEHGSGVWWLWLRGQTWWGCDLGQDHSRG